MKKLLLLLMVGSLFMGCEEDNPEGCCYFSFVADEADGIIWNCTDESFKLSCEQVENSYHLEGADCVSIGYCEESSCEAMGCQWEVYGLQDWCTCD